jgi:hypothetical protein
MAAAGRRDRRRARGISVESVKLAGIVDSSAGNPREKFLLLPCGP